MRKARLAIAISMSAHAALIAWASRDREKPEPVPVVAPPEQAATAAAPEPPAIAVVLLDGYDVGRRVPATATASQPSQQRSSAPARSKLPAAGGQRLSTHGARGSEAAAPATGTGGGVMSMRSPGDRGQSLKPRFLAVSGRLMDDYVPDVPDQLPPPSGALRQKGRNYVSTHEGNPDDETFRATVAPDGTVTLRDTPDVTIHWNWRTPLLVFGKIAVDDAIMRKKGFDPYASAKLKWLDKTRDERFLIGKAYRKEQLVKSALLMRDNLARLWERERDLAERKQLVFALWDECAETGDAELVDGGQRARAYLYGFVRSHLPAGTASGYTADELAALNARKRSSATFAPY